MPTLRRTGHRQALRIEFGVSGTVIVAGHRGRIDVAGERLDYGEARVAFEGRRNEAMSKVVQ